MKDFPWRAYFKDVTGFAHPSAVTYPDKPQALERARMDVLNAPCLTSLYGVTVFTKHIVAVSAARLTCSPEDEVR